MNLINSHWVIKKVDIVVGICDSLKDTIIVYSPQTNKLSPIENKTRIYRPAGITFDNNGYLFITDRYWIRKMSISDGTTEKIAGAQWYGIPGHKDGEAKGALFVELQGIALSDDGTLYLCDRGNHCIRKLKDGIVSTITGIAGSEGHRDGECKHALFTYPTSLVLLENKLLLVADNSSLRVIPRSLTVDRSGTIWIGGPKMLMLMRFTWMNERWLWVGHLKERSDYCWLACLPRELAKSIASYVKERPSANLL